MNFKVTHEMYIIWCGVSFISNVVSFIEATSRIVKDTIISRKFHMTYSKSQHEQLFDFIDSANLHVHDNHLFVIILQMAQIHSQRETYSHI